MATPKKRPPVVLIVILLAVAAVGILAMQDITPETKMVTKIIHHDALK